MYTITFDNVSKAYGNTKVMEDINLTIRSGERLILLGPSGCGKTTMLRMISGLEDVTSGQLFMGGNLVNEVPPGDRNIAMVFQNYALFPHMSVYDNIVFGLRTQKLQQHEKKEKVNNMLSMLNLTGLETRKPKELSGGQRQRVALARAAVKRAPYFLLDEPLSNLDAQLRVHARNELVKLHKMYEPTFVYVTHDQIETMTVGDRVVILNKGAIQMIDTPTEIYNRPANVFTARFIGAPPMNILQADIDDRCLRLNHQRIPLSDSWLDKLGTLKKVLIGIRPENVRLSDIAHQDAIALTVQYAEDYGSNRGCYCDIGDQTLIALTDNHLNVRPGHTLYWLPNALNFSFFDPFTEQNLGYPDFVGQMTSCQVLTPVY